MKLEQKTQLFIEKFHIFEKGEGIIVGLSGGADSVALLEVLCELRAEYGLRLAAVHVHHGIREEAQQDVDFCKVLCEKKRVLFRCEYDYTTIRVLQSGYRLTKDGDSLMPQKLPHLFAVWTIQDL